jgi:hypothetical protein
MDIGVSLRAGLVTLGARNAAQAARAIISFFIKRPLSPDKADK